MNTGNNTAGKTAPERYVSEKAFEELPDAFQKLAELLGEDQFELVAVNEKDSQDIYVQDGEIRLVYLMNDAVESFLVFGNARMTGVYKPDYEEEILADLSHQGREYILVTAGAGGNHSTAPYHIEDAVTVYRRVSRGS